jgi:ClpP class serine protease
LARFVRLVAEARKIPEARVREFADGRIYTAEQAHALGLVDKIGYLDEAVTAARQAAGLPGGARDHVSPAARVPRQSLLRIPATVGHGQSPDPGRRASRRRAGRALPLPLVAVI